MMMDRVHVEPGAVGGAVRIPSSKSIGHRAIICAGLTDGVSTIHNVTMSKDIEATIGAMKALEASIECGKEGALRVVGLRSRTAARDRIVSIDCHESGSTLRFMIPLAAALGIPAQFSGQGRLAERPLDVYYDLFRKQKLRYETQSGGLPLVVLDPLQPGTFSVAGNISSQFITGLLLALPLLQQDSVIEVTAPLESIPYVDLTLQVLRTFGITVEHQGYERFQIPGGQRYEAQECTVEGDYSQAAFFMAAAAVAGKKEGLCLEGLSPCSAQGDRVICDILQSMGARIVWEREDAVKVYPCEKLRGRTLDVSQCPDLVPILAVLGAFAEGTTAIINAQRLRYKESDRLAAVWEELSAVGVNIEQTEDGLRIAGRPNGGYPGGEAKSWNDHRIAMAMAILALKTQGGVSLTGAGSVAKSWPSFWEDLTRIGGVLHE
ncbi:3-phosphoshikimate 1-carboxyvinyltransferase [Bianquea renquensis]|nr:3-phosphoshikimate 1-carboxyvinyltransferase [Bianquea renquensis]